MSGCGLPLGRQSSSTVVVSLELALGAAQCLNYSIGKGGQELVCQRRTECEQPIAGIVLHFQQQRVLLHGASTAAAATVDKRNLSEDARWAQAREYFFGSVEAYVHCAFHDHEASVAWTAFREQHLALACAADACSREYFRTFLG